MANICSPAGAPQCSDQVFAHQRSRRAAASSFFCFLSVSPGCVWVCFFSLRHSIFTVFIGEMTEMKHELNFWGGRGKQLLFVEILCVCARKFVPGTVALWAFLFVSPRCKAQHWRNHSPTHTHTKTHINLFTQTYPSSTAATQQMWRAGFNFLAPFPQSQPHAFFITTILFLPTAAAQWYWLAIKPSNCYKEVNILKLLRFSAPLTLMCAFQYGSESF